MGCGVARPRGLVAFISDFGPQSPYVGLVHLVIEKLGGGRVRVVDLSHEVKSFSVYAGAYTLLAALGYAPEGTVFLVVVDPGVGGPRDPVAVETRRYYLVGPNNGVLWPAIEEDGFVRAVRLDNEAFWLKPTSHTFHGRDIFAPAATMLALGVDIEALGSPLPRERLQRLELIRVEERGDAICLRAVYIDKFGNVALSARRGEAVWEKVCREGGVVEVCGGGGRCIEARCARTFSEVSAGEAALYYNSFGFLEVAVYMGSAAEALGVGEGGEVCLRAR